MLINLETSQRRMTDLLLSGGESQPLAAEQSFRYVAAHLAAMERECFMDRIIRIAKGRNTAPFENFSENGRDLSGLELDDSVDGWRAARKAIFAYLRTLPDSAWAFTGRHIQRGAITIADVLQEMLDHDQEHFEELSATIARL